MPIANIKQLAKFYNEEILKDTSLSMDTVIEVTAEKAGIGAETVKDALQGKAKLTSEVLEKIFEALGISLQTDDEGPCPGGMERDEEGNCPPPGNGNGNGEAEHPCGPGETPEKDGCVEKPASTVGEQLDNTFGKDALGNHFNEVLTLIKATKDVETGRYLSEIFRKVFETIPIIIKAEQGDKITEYTKKVNDLEKKLTKSTKELKELQATIKKVPKLTEALEKVGKLQGGKGLYEQSTETDRTKTNELAEMSLSDFHREKIPNFD